VTEGDRVARALAEVEAALGPEAVVRSPGALWAYSADGNPDLAARPGGVVLPSRRADVAAAVAALHRHGVAVVARGAGTGLSGGAVAEEGGVLLDLARLDRILEVDPGEGWLRAEPGVTNLAVGRRAAGLGMFFAPDPSSQVACTLGGNVAENSGGGHCLKYGVTLQHVMALEAVTAGGGTLSLGGLAPDLPGYDLLGLFVGSEGTLGVATEVTVRLMPAPEATRTVLMLFDREEDASETVSEVIAAGILPAAMEMMDNLAVAGVERGPYRVGFPPDVGAVLLVEVDGLEAGLDEQAERIAAIARRRGVREARLARDEGERALWWANRKTAFGAMGNLAPAYLVQDGVIPRSRLVRVLGRVREIARSEGVRVANVFHAGDGNLHPLILYDPAEPGAAARARRAGAAMLRVCVDEGGSITGEHGVGSEKREEMAYQFTPAELALMRSVRGAWDPEGLFNPGKVLPPERPGTAGAAAPFGPTGGDA
jgi:glycolate oxidase subunit GlcD